MIEQVKSFVDSLKNNPRVPNFDEDHRGDL